MANPILSQLLALNPSGGDDWFTRRLAERTMIDPSLGTYGPQTGGDWIASSGAAGPETAEEIKKSPSQRALFALGSALVGAGGGNPNLPAWEALSQRRQEAAQSQKDKEFAYKTRSAERSEMLGERAETRAISQSRYDDEKKALEADRAARLDIQNRTLALKEQEAADERAWRDKQAAKTEADPRLKEVNQRLETIREWAEQGVVDMTDPKKWQDVYDRFQDAIYAEQLDKDDIAHFMRSFLRSFPKPETMPGPVDGPGTGLDVGDRLSTAAGAIANPLSLAGAVAPEVSRLGSQVPGMLTSASQGIMDMLGLGQQEERTPSMEEWLRKLAEQQTER